MRTEQTAGWEQPHHVGHCHWFPNSKRLVDVLARSPVHSSCSRPFYLFLLFFLIWVFSLSFPPWLLGTADGYQHWVEEYHFFFNFIPLRLFFFFKILKNILRETKFWDTNEKGPCVSAWPRTRHCGLAGRQTCYLQIVAHIIPEYGTVSTIVVSVSLQT